MKHQKSQRKIVWDDIEFGDIEFVVHPTQCMRAYAQHKKARCAGRHVGAYTPAGIAHYGTPGIHRFTTYIHGQKVSDVVVCTACQVPVGKAAFRKLEGMNCAEVKTKEVASKFGPVTLNVRTDYFKPIKQLPRLREIRFG